MQLCFLPNTELPKFLFQSLCEISREIPQLSATEGHCHRNPRLGRRKKANFSMDNEFFLNAEMMPPPPQPSLPSSLSSASAGWHSLPSSMEMDHVGDQCLFWGNSPEPRVFASPNLHVSNESFVIRELIGRLGAAGNNSGDIMSPTYKLSNVDSHSPSEMDPVMTSGRGPTQSSPLADFSGDPGFIQRAAAFSRFGSRSFNGRNLKVDVINHYNNSNGSNNNSIIHPGRPGGVPASNAQVSRVASSPSLNPVGSLEESTVSEQTPKGEFSRKRKSAPKGKPKENGPAPSLSINSAKFQEDDGKEDSSAKRTKSSEKNENHHTTAVKSEEGAKKEKEEQAPEPPKDYIHVRARRGQATDSHSLAERVRREKISERMKLLQDLVPGCNKVTGKALMLDEIINYVQSLQRQVEFLSMKLASVNTTRLDFNTESLASKNMVQSSNSVHNPIFPVGSSAAQAMLGQQPGQSCPANGTMVSRFAIDPMDSTSLCPNFNMQLPPQFHQFPHTPNQNPAFFEGDLQAIVQMGLGQNQSLTCQGSEGLINSKANP